MVSTFGNSCYRVVTNIWKEILEDEPRLSKSDVSTDQEDMEDYGVNALSIDHQGDHADVSPELRAPLQIKVMMVLHEEN
jgi:hypothetical protein